MDITKLIMPTLSQTANLTGHSIPVLHMPTPGLHVPGPRTVTHEGQSFSSSEMGLLIPSR